MFNHKAVKRKFSIKRFITQSDVIIHAVCFIRQENKWTLLLKIYKKKTTADKRYFQNVGKLRPNEDIDF